MIGKRIRKLRHKKGYSLTELAGLAGVSKSYLSNIERDLQSNPSLLFLSKIANTLDTSIEYLLGESIGSTDTKEILLDEEWKTLLEKAIEDGMSKEDFLKFREYIRFKNWERKPHSYQQLENWEARRKKRP
jgi:XRE family transcriptional regulator of biofilm formation